jgi:hypothetical protein
VGLAIVPGAVIMAKELELLKEGVLQPWAF